jgi:hypothetical protein
VNGPPPLSWDLRVERSYAPNPPGRGPIPPVTVTFTAEFPTDAEAQDFERKMRAMLPEPGRDAVAAPADRALIWLLLHRLGGAAEISDWEAQRVPAGGPLNWERRLGFDGFTVSAVRW